MTPTAVHYRPAHELLDALRRGEITSEALTEALFARIDQHNSAVNAVVTQDRQAALAKARRTDELRRAGEIIGPLHGLPLTLKDTWEVAGMVCTAGAPMLADHHPRRHADIARRLEEAGAIIIGKTNVPMFAMDIQSYNKLFGVTTNPYNRTRTSGGSSGGAAAALAAGMTPLEVGSDLAGSIRTPAHFCGVFGHKPTRDLVSLRGHIPGPPGALSQPDLAEGGPMARTARDLELLLRVIGGPRDLEGRSWTLDMAPPRISALNEARVGLWLEDPLCPVDDDLIRNYRALADRLGNLGALVSDARHELLAMQHILPAYFNLLGTLTSSALKPAQRRQMAWLARLEPIVRRFSPLTYGVRDYAKAINQPAYQWMSWNETREKMRASLDELFTEFDVLLTPVTPTVAIPHDHTHPPSKRRIRVNGRERAYMDQFCWIALATLLGLPATSVPLGLDRDGLPFSIQVIGAAGMDLTTIRFAELLEQAGLAGFRAPEGF